VTIASVRSIDEQQEKKNDFAASGTQDSRSLGRGVKKVPRGSLSARKAIVLDPSPSFLTLKTELRRGLG